MNNCSENKMIQILKNIIMNRKFLILTIFNVITILFLLTPKTYASGYTITFTATGASTTIENVIVQNLTKGTTVTVPTGNVLNLIIEPNAVEQVTSTDEDIRVYTNSINGKSTISFLAQKTGNAEIKAFSIDGKEVAVISTTLQTGRSYFEMSLPKGVFLIQVIGNGYKYSTKTVSQMASRINPKIVQIGTEAPEVINIQKSKESNLGITTMSYNNGDRLLYKAISGNYTTIVTDVPNISKTTNFEFVECKDADGNYYTIVKIGNQTWMAENLKTTKYNDKSTLSTNDCFDYYNNQSYSIKYGKLYSWNAVSNIKKIAPLGWHVPSDDEWSILENYLITNGYNFDSTNSDSKIGKSLAASTDWNLSTVLGAIGNDITKNNSSGFSALPSGYRYFMNDGSYALGTNAVWWSNTLTSNSENAWSRTCGYNTIGLARNSTVKYNGLSVRCVRD